MGDLAHEADSARPAEGTTGGAGRPYEERLDTLAVLALRVGVNFQHDGRLRLTGPLAASDLMRRITIHAYEMGARYVDVQYVDQHVTLARALHARAETLDEVPQEHADLANVVAARGDASIRVSGADPDLMSAADPERIVRMTTASRRATRAAQELAMRSFMPWTVVPFAAPEWARKVFPDLGEDDAQERLWDAIFAATRVDADDPLAAWQAHVGRLGRLAADLNERAFEALHLRGPGTDLRVGLAVRHVWEGGSVQCGVNGLAVVPNMPTEEVFTAPHARRVDGRVRASKPLSYQGQLIEGFSLTFEDGVVVDFSAERGERVLQGLLDTDEGARRLGEVALVPHSSPIGQSGLLFYDTLFDENAASHLALGRAYPTSVRDGASRSPDETAADGLNQSLVHVDLMVGSADVDVDGLRGDGTVVSVMRGGAWTID